METKLLLQDLADLMARHDGITKKKADAFVRAFFETIRQGLETDRYVKIKGFGTFKLVEVGERESVNISTGERFQISGHAKISFTPDAALKDLVNRPFAHFQTITLSEDVNLDELESVQVEEEVIPQVPLPAPEPAEEIPAQAEEVPAQAEEVPVQAEEIPEPAEEVPVQAEEVPVPAEEVPEPAEEIPAPAEEVPEPAEEEPVQDEEVIEPAEKVPEPAEEIPAPAEEEPVQAEEVPEPAEEVPVPAEEVIETAEPENPQVTACACNTPEESNEEEPADATMEEEEQESPAADPAAYAVNQEIIRGYKRWKLTAIILFVIILMVLSYFAGYFKMFCPCEWSTPASTTASTPAAPAKTAAPGPVAQKAEAPKGQAAAPHDNLPATTAAPDGQPAAPAEKPAAPAKKATQPAASTAPAKSDSQPAPTTPQNGNNLAQVKGGKYIITGTRENYRVARGETLRSIAEYAYGSKGYAQYIIVHNHIKDPDNIAAGTILKLPELERR
ncbi:MAG: HU family DNA-binding protein [Bacteroidales bacterium]|nr:HU family DNA-binding protein [Bacteroidales bacterium]